MREITTPVEKVVTIVEEKSLREPKTAMIEPVVVVRQKPKPEPKLKLAKIVTEPKIDAPKSTPGRTFDAGPVAPTQETVVAENLVDYMLPEPLSAETEFIFDSALISERDIVEHPQIFTEMPSNENDQYVESTTVEINAESEVPAPEQIVLQTIIAESPQADELRQVLNEKLETLTHEQTETLTKISNTIIVAVERLQDIQVTQPESVQEIEAIEAYVEAQIIELLTLLDISYDTELIAQYKKCIMQNISLAKQTKQLGEDAYGSVDAGTHESKHGDFSMSGLGAHILQAGRLPTLFGRLGELTLREAYA